MADVQPVSHTLIYHVALPFPHDIPDSGDVVFFDCLKEFRVGQLFFLDLFDELAILVAEDERVKFVIKIFGKAVEESIVELN